MLYPTLDSLVEKIGNRYLLVNVTAKRAREIAQEAADQGIRLTDKPVRLAVLEIAEGKYVYDPTAEQKDEAAKDSADAENQELSGEEAGGAEASEDGAGEEVLSEESDAE